MKAEEKELLLKNLCARYPYGLKGQVVIEASTGEYDIYSGCLEYTDVDVDVELFGIEGEDITVYPIDDKYNDVISDYNYTVEDFLPYLRPMSSMTQKEIDEYDAELDKDMDIVISGAFDKDKHITSDGKHNFSKNFVAYFGNDWLNKKMFDYRGLIEKGLALEAPEGMYKI